MNLKYMIAFALMLIASMSRLLPHPYNFTPIAAITIFSSTYFDKKISIIVALFSMLISDYFLGFYSGMEWIYGSMIIGTFLGYSLKNDVSIRKIGMVVLANSFSFYLITNFGVWLNSLMYEKSISGLITCYVAAIPFYRNSLAGDVFYTFSIFGVAGMLHLFNKTKNYSVVNQ